MIHILGAGVAGLMLAAALDRRGKSWRLYEKEAQAGLHASGKNAGIIRTYETDPVMRHFAAASLGYYREYEPTFTERGMILRPWEVDYAAAVPQRRSFSHRRFEGLFLPENGTIEPADLMRRLRSTVFKHGKITFNFETLIHHQADTLLALTSQSGQEVSLRADDVIVAACGEGAVTLAESLGRPLGLIAHRRTLYEFKNALGADGPVEWDEESGVYFRPVGDVLLATAGEQIPSAQGVETGDGADAKMLAILARENPFMTRDNLISSRTCKRLTPLDNRPYAGRDPRFKNLFWFTGLGGRGISTAPALAEALADDLCGEAATDFMDALSPLRA